MHSEQTVCFAIARRSLLGVLVLLAAMAAAPASAKPRSYTATHGAAPFSTEHLLPGSPLALSRVRLSAPAARVIALTIDDGPDHNDLKLLEILREHGARATFFYIGAKLPAERAVAARVAGSGNEVGNHTQDHPMLTDLAPPAQRQSLTGAAAALARIGVKAAWFRPPYGDFDGGVVAEARRLGMATVLWTIDSQDWKGLDRDAIMRRVVDRLHPGAIVLLHSTKAASVAALPGILDAGKRQGYRFVTLTEWLAVMTAAVAP
ncbi:MAG: polysaccharide deacetylase family protein [Azospirillum sp.]|nr:polysaccharide deacetylase family protein [Azospirillum sp.]